jgi:hypothetical protein
MWYIDHTFRFATMHTMKEIVLAGASRRATWWKHQEIRLFWEPDIHPSTIKVVMNEFELLCRAIGVKFKLIPFGSHQSAMRQLQAVTNGNQVDYNRFFDIVSTEVWRNESIGGREHGDIFITTKYLLNDTVSLGIAGYKAGGVLFALHGQSQYNSTLLRRLVRHEATHLMGLGWHCDHPDFRVNGYHYSGKCNMHYHLPSGETCQKCLDYLRAFWQHLGRA